MSTPTQGGVRNGACHECALATDSEWSIVISPCLPETPIVFRQIPPKKPGVTGKYQWDFMLPGIGLKEHKYQEFLQCMKGHFGQEPCPVEVRVRQVDRRYVLADKLWIMKDLIFESVFYVHWDDSGIYNLEFDTSFREYSAK